MGGQDHGRSLDGSSFRRPSHRRPDRSQTFPRDFLLATAFYRTETCDADPQPDTDRPCPPRSGPCAGPCRRAPETVDVLGIPLARIDYEGTLDWIEATVARHERRYVCVAATHTVMACREDPELRAAVLAGDLTVPDGQPLVWAMNAFGAELQDRVYGPELMARACERAAADRDADVPLRRPQPGRARPAGLQPAHALPGAADRRRLRPALPVAVERRGGRRRPPDRPLAAPTSSGWASACPSRRSGWRPCAPASRRPCSSGVGAAFDFHAGLVPQAPGWMQAVGPRVALPARRGAAPAVAGATCATTRASCAGFARQCARPRGRSRRTSRRR